MTKQELVENSIRKQRLAFGKRLRALRRQAMFSQWALARMVGTNPSTLSGWERGIDRISLDTVYRLAAALGCSISFLVAGDGGTRPFVSHDDLSDRVSALEAEVFGAEQSVAPEDEEAVAVGEIDADMVKVAIEEISDEGGN